MLDRTKAPALSAISFQQLPTPQVQTLTNGVKLHVLRGGTQDVTKIDFVLPAGKVYAEKPLLADAANTLVAEGTQNHTSSQVSEQLDNYGAYMWQSSYSNYAVLSVCMLTKHYNRVMPIIEEIIKQPSYPQEELDIYLAKNRQDYLIELQKTSVVASRKMRENLYKKGHPYGRLSTLESYDNIFRSDLVEFHEKCYSPTDTHIYLCGQPNDGVIDCIERMFGTSWQAKPHLNLSIPADGFAPNFGTLTQRVEGATQATIRMALPLFNRKHSDFIGMSILNTILGGYFGSRLMTSIREEKGLTYGIGSNLSTTSTDGFLSIGSNVKAELKDEALDAIFAEIALLRNENIDQMELDIVRNYLRGELLRSLDGNFAQSDQIRDFDRMDISAHDYFKSYYKTLAEITPNDLQHLAQKYLREEDFRVVLAF